MRSCFVARCGRLHVGQFLNLSALNAENDFYHAFSPSNTSSLTKASMHCVSFRPCGPCGREISTERFMNALQVVDVWPHTEHLRLLTNWPWKSSTRKLLWLCLYRSHSIFEISANGILSRRFSSSGVSSRSLLFSAFSFKSS